MKLSILPIAALTLLLTACTAPADPGEVEIESDVAASTPGVYEVSYTYRGDTVYQTVVVR